MAGRPKLPESERRTVECRVRMTKAEQRVLIDGAAAAGVPLARYMREVALGEREVSPPCGDARVRGPN